MAAGVRMLALVIADAGVLEAGWWPVAAAAMAGTSVQQTQAEAAAKALPVARVVMAVGGEEQ